MRDKKWFARADWILWTLISILPLLSYLIYLSNGDVSHSADTFTTFMNSFGLYTSATNPLRGPLIQLFGAGGVFPLFSTSTANLGSIYYIMYFISINLIHVFVDFLLFIPRLAHKFMDGLLGGD